MVGGGSGGHVTPVAAVIREVKKLQPKSEIHFWCDKKFSPQAKLLIEQLGFDIPVSTIFAGKFRRYNHLSVWQHLIWPSLMFANFKDLVFIGLGFFESIFKLIIWRPDVVFTKGGYVCLPVGIAAKILRIPLVIHDSDAHPGLTNRILGRWASAIATGAPLEFYSYPEKISKYVGIPISSEFFEYSKPEQVKAKKEWGIRTDKPLVVVTGGGLGATRINNTIILALDDLLKFCSIVLVSGVSQYEELRRVTPANGKEFQLHSFISKNMASLLGAADIVVARAGATTILELASLKKPTILIPNAKLTGGHQLKNTAVYLAKNAVTSVDEEDMIDDKTVLTSAIKEIIDNPKKAKMMSLALGKFAKPDAAIDVAKMIIKNSKLKKI